MKIITKEELANAVKINKIPGLASVLMELMKLNDINEVFSKNQQFEGLEFVDKVLETIGVSVDIPEGDLKNIPKNGAFIAIANHPYGGVEGLALVKLLCTVRPEAKVMVNFILKKIPNLSEFFVAVNPFETVQHASSISGIKTTLGLLKEGVPLGIFPAGEVSTFNNHEQKITDKKWNPVIGKIIEKAQVPVVPIYFHGNNGILFSIISMLHPSLRTAKLPSEFLNKHGKVIKVRIGKPIDLKDIDYKNDTQVLLDFLRARTYALGLNIDQGKKLFNPISLFQRKPKPDEIIPPVETSQLLSEIAELGNFKVWTEKQYEVYITPSQNIPCLLREIGRLREVTFRQVGEGTNLSIDLDNYDVYYNHLFIWDVEEQRLVGAYRIGKGDEILDTVGISGLYISTLFNIREDLYEYLYKGIELGRSFICKEYQNKPLPLFLLWKAILKYLLLNPQYRYLYGPVSISNHFSKYSKTLIVDYIRRNNFDEKLASYVSPQNEFVPELMPLNTGLLSNQGGKLKDLDALISDIERDHAKVPVLLRQYLQLNGKIISFNIDPKFADCLDGFLFVDLQQIPLDILEKLNKNL